MTRMPGEENIREILSDRRILEEISGYPVRDFLSEGGARSKAARPSAKLRNCVWKDDKEHPSF